MNLVEAINAVDRFAFDHNILGGRAVIPAKLNEVVIKNNNELRNAMLVLGSKVPNINDSISENGYTVQRLLAAKSGNQYLHWIKDSSNVSTDVEDFYSQFNISPVEA